jgi:hypothetical protein
MISRLIKIIFFLFLSLFLYITTLSIYLKFGDENAVSRSAQLLLTLIISSLPIMHERIIKIIGRKRFAILFSDLALVSLIPFSVIRAEAVSTITAFIFLVSFPILINHRFSTSFLINVFHISIYRPFFIVVTMEKEMKLDGSFYSFGIGLSKEMAGMIAARRARKLIKHGKVIVPISREKGNNTEYIKNLDILQTLSFAMNKDITFIESGRTDYQGYVDAIIERYGSCYSVSVFGSEPYSMTEDEFILLKHIYSFISV